MREEKKGGENEKSKNRNVWKDGIQRVTQEEMFLGNQNQNQPP